ncbi:phage tail protein [Chromobacterium vaccinii]|uniref:phage tail protein n=1 Tax=Chromobacterium vaccinii TaxID=1108595 RepID=UPI000CE98C96|nr:phage tail protein [Chromobacterium vaccinii]AVG16333.1 phage tail protein [Chromobacterium vaccinii]
MARFTILSGGDVAEVFSWTPLFGGASSIRARVREARFGDGYGQRVPDGINSMPRVRKLSFAVGQAEADAIEAFLMRHAGARWFWFTYPGAARAKFRCSEWDRSYLAAEDELVAATFEQVFDPGE